MIESERMRERREQDNRLRLKNMDTTQKQHPYIDIV